ncbi:MAG: hypothetical protein JXQ75_01865 [Phycisphaerae bacterium]|nr:hypothetical protein [Phycisphaerae bacterium]
MCEPEWIVTAGFLALGAMTFLYLLASVRDAVVQQAEAERHRKEAAEQAARAAEATVGIPEAVELGEIR